MALPGWPSCAQPLHGPEGRAWMPGTCAGDLLALEQMYEEGQGTSLSVQGWGRGAVTCPAPASGDLRTLTHTENERHNHARHVHTRKIQASCPGSKTRDMVTSREDWCLACSQKDCRKQESWRARPVEGRESVPEGRESRISGRKVETLRASGSP